MNLDEMKEKAVSLIESANPRSSHRRVTKVLENIMDGTLISVTFFSPEKKEEETNHVHFGKDEVRTYRWHGDVLAAVSGYRERRWFFRFLELAGIGGLIAFVLVVLFAIFLCALAFYYHEFTKDILDVVKLAFTTILGYFFGSQMSQRK